MDDFMAITKALADENRVRTLMALRTGELCACQITDFLKLAPSTVSRHMSVLKHAGLVNNRKQGRWMYYRLSGKDAPQNVKSAISWVRRSLKDIPSVYQDEKRIAEIIKEHEEGRCQTGN